MRDLQAMHGIRRAKFAGLHDKRAESGHDGQQEDWIAEFATQRKH